MLLGACIADEGSGLGLGIITDYQHKSVQGRFDVRLNTEEVMNLIPGSSEILACLLWKGNFDD
jgi:hypothetical protein